MTEIIIASMGFGGVLGFALGFFLATALSSPTTD